jgi:hypothetical protein
MNRIGVDFDEIAEGGPKAVDGFENNILGGINKLLHVVGG